METSHLMRRKAQLFYLAIAIPALMSLAACGGGGSGSATIKSVVISPTSATVPVNTTTQFTATVNLSNSTTTTNTAVTWQVNGVAGGSSTTGTIAPSTTDVQVGIYTAPAVAPGGTDNGQVDVTAVATQTTTGTTTTPVTVTSNTAVVTIGAGEGLAVNPLTTTVPAGASRLFAATLNSVADPSATWTISPTAGTGQTASDIGSIDPTTGLYTAPFFPPPGGSITVTAKDGSATAIATATIVFSDASLKGPFAFSYSGDNLSGFQAVAGSFIADGAGTIVSGVEDIDSFSTGASTALAISGNYVVGPDGRGTITLNSGQQSEGTLQFALTTNQHASVIRFDRNVTGSGNIDQQNLNDLTSSPTVVSGPYVFSVAGADSSFNPMGLVGKFAANGSGVIPTAGTTPILDAKINGIATTEDTSLTGSYSFDASRSGSGRGTITLASNTTHSIEYAFYIVDSTHLLLVEIDHTAFLAGDMFSAPVGNSFSATELTAGKYAFTNGGTTTMAAYATGGIFTSDGGGNITGGTADSNIGGTVTSGSALGSCPYTVNNPTGRIDLKLFTGTGACPGGASASVAEFAMYQTSADSAVMLELDSAATANGVAYLQQITPAAVSGIFALNLGGQGNFHNSPASFQPDANGQLTLAATAISAGTLDINSFNSVFTGDPLDPINSKLTAPDTTLGRGTAMILGTDPAVTYNVAYYVVDGNRALVFGMDTVRTVTGIVNRQSPPPAN
jgi:hypothetical protein